MLFSSLIFIWFFLPASFFLYSMARKIKLKNAVLLMVSLFFYSWGEPVYVLLLLLSILINYIAGLILTACQKQGTANKVVVFICVMFNLLLLGYFKYFTFTAELFNHLTGQTLLPIKELALPLGISFYTFQAISYIVDIYRGTPAQKNLFYAALYICLFPQILSGPIIKYHELAPQLKERTETLSMRTYGIKRFVYGLSKKVLIANSLGQVVDQIMAVPTEQVGTVTAWLFVILYTMQIYYDFSGYSDMAIGLGSMFGFHYLENFNYPYLSASITEFWRRWHISLSSWFRDYLYIPLGGNRKGLARTCINLFIVFLATGLWHGASMTFIFWGIYHGIFIMIERFWLKDLLKKNPHPWINHLYTILVVMIGWLFFRADTVGSAFLMLKTMFVPTTGFWNPRIFANNKVLFLIAMSILLCGPLQSLLPNLNVHLFDEEKIKGWDIGIMSILLLLSTIVLVSGTYSAFIYFRF